MNHHLKALLCMLSVILAGCNLDIYFVGEGHVTSTDGRVSCSAEPCSRRTTLETSVSLNGHPAPGYSFLGFSNRVTSNSDVFYSAGQENYWVRFGGSIDHNPITWPIDFGPLFEYRPVQRSAKVTAIFWPADDITQSLVSSDDVCLIDRGNQLHCWGSNDSYFPPDGALKLVTETKWAFKWNLCVLYTDTILCRFRGERDWLIPDDITQPQDAALHENKLCIQHGTAHGNAVYCATQRGQQVMEVPALSNPINLHVSDAGQFCVEDEGQAVCW